jgi:hypothetical protein
MRLLQSLAPPSPFRSSATFSDSTLTILYSSRTSAYTAEAFSRCPYLNKGYWVMGHDNCTETWTLADGSKLKLRHISATDFDREQAFVRGLSAQSSYLRFHGTIKDLSNKDLEKFTNPDSRNAVALIALRRGETGEEEIGYPLLPERHKHLDGRQGGPVASHPL